MSTAVLDGTTQFNIDGYEDFFWGGGFLRSIDLWNNNPSDSVEVALSLAGSNWGIRDISADGMATHQITITDADSSAGRHVELMGFYSVDSLLLNLQTTSSRSIFAQYGTHELLLGRGWFGHVQLDNAQYNSVENLEGGTIQGLIITGPDDNYIDNSMTVGGHIYLIRIWRGDNRVEVAETGRIESLKIDEALQNNISVADGGGIDYASFNGRLNSDTSGDLNHLDNFIDVQGEIRSLNTWAANNLINVSGKVKSLCLRVSVSTVTVHDGGQINDILAYGSTTLLYMGDANSWTIKLDLGLQYITTDTGFLETYHAWNSTSTLKIGTGGIGQVLLQGTGGLQRIDVEGFAGSIQIYGDLDSELSFHGGIGSLVLGQNASHKVEVTGGWGDDLWNGTLQVRGTADITTGTGTVEAIITRLGNDSITTGKGVIGLIASGGGKDRITLGKGGADEVRAGDGNDTVIGSQRGDYILGGSGNDRLAGEGGNDTLVGGAGTDQLSGGSGADSFLFNAISDTAATSARDVILEFALGDKIDLSAIDANTSLPDDQAFSFLGNAAFTALGQLRYKSVGSIWLMEGNCNGNMGADFSIEIRNGYVMGASDFVL